ncbi:MAG: putative molybdenum carrier protein [Pirellulales bacterium]|nr:putative molybdenum carrier protein [Pirellulales bacterium]
MNKKRDKDASSLFKGNFRKKLTIVSGGQTGVDRAALDLAIEMGLAHDGWCPRGRHAEDGMIPACYALSETPSTEYAQRTQWNIRDSDATVIFSDDRKVRGGTALTIQLAKRLGKPCLHLIRTQDPVKNAAERLHAFLQENQVKRLNVAGPRASMEPEAASYARAVISSLLDANCS